MKYFNWAFINLSILFLFWYGHLNFAEWAINISHFFLWLAAISGVLGFLIIRKESIKQIISESDTNRYFPYKEHLDLIYDLIMLSSIVSLGYWYLGVFYSFNVIISQMWILESKKLYYK